VNRRDLLGTLLAAAAASPLAARAQKAMPVIGFLSFTFSSGDPLPAVVQAFLAGLEETGHVAGRNVMIEYRWRKADPTACRPWPPTLSAARSI
jgi:putative ABC transport system substrate-binding protein